VRSSKPEVGTRTPEVTSERICEAKGESVLAGDRRVTLEAVVMGRAGADLYPNNLSTPLSEVRTYTRFAGGFAVNVATGLARLGVSTAIVSKVGTEGHGDFIRDFLAAEGVDVRWLGADTENLTPVVFCEVWPPDHFPLVFYRRPTAPDWEITTEDFDIEELREAPLVYVSGTGLAREPSRSATLAVARSHRGLTVFDLDWRSSLWRDPSEYPEVASAAMEGADVVVGNEQELCAAAVVDDPDEAARRLLEGGVGTIVIKRGAKGVTALSGGQVLEVPGIEAYVVNGLGAGDAFAAALAHGLLRRIPLNEILRRANAAGAIVAEQLPCSEAMPTADELESFLQARG
jgi:5-dehydro-2-deoxygluconokinase